MNIIKDMVDNNYQDPKHYKSNLTMNPSLRRRRNVHTETFLQAGVDYALNDQEQYDRLKSNFVQCPLLPRSHSDTVNRREENVIDESSIDLSESHEDISVAIKNAVLSIVKNEPISPTSANSDPEIEQRIDNRRKRKYSSGDEEERDIREPGLVTAKNQEEIIKAARSLFSKRTRTLYNWLSPGISKTKLKATVSTAWDGLPSIEKDFYISQVLGRFGVPSVKVMVNPQILGFNGTGPQATITTRTEQNMTEFMNNMCKKKRVRRSSPNSSSLSINEDKPERKGDDKIIIKQLRDDSLHDFVDDPELHKEFEQFKWALQVTNAQD